MTRWAKHQPDAIQVTVELVHDQTELNDDFLKPKNGSVPIAQGGNRNRSNLSRPLRYHHCLLQNANAYRQL